MLKTLRMLLLQSLVATSAVAALAAEFGNLPSSFATLDGTQVHYWGQGEGQRAVVFVHGWGCDATVWRYQTAAIPDGWRAIFVDLPGHGRSPAPAADYSMDYLARGVAASIEHAGVNQVVLVGHSNGVPVVRQFFRRYPDMTLGLVAVEGSFRPLVADPQAWDQMIAPFREDTYREALRTMVPKDLEEDLAGDIRTMMLETPQHVLVSSLEALGDEEIWNQDPITAPLLVILAKTPLWTLEYENFVRTLAPHVDYRIFDGASHFLQLGSPEAFNEALAEFLDRLNSRSTDGR